MAKGVYEGISLNHIITKAGQNRDFEGEENMHLRMDEI